jgi:hypothetical protein
MSPNVDTNYFCILAMGENVDIDMYIFSMFNVNFASNVCTRTNYDYNEPVNVAGAGQTEPRRDNSHWTRSGTLEPDTDVENLNHGMHTLVFGDVAKREGLSH